MFVSRARSASMAPALRGKLAQLHRPRPELFEDLIALAAVWKTATREAAAMPERFAVLADVVDILLKSLLLRARHEQVENLRPKLDLLAREIEEAVALLERPAEARMPPARGDRPDDRGERGAVDIAA